MGYRDRIESQCEEATEAEEKWFKKLQRVFDANPNKKGIWLFSASGTLHAMKTPPDGEEMGSGSDGCGVNQMNIVHTFRGIRNDGGDW